MKTPPHSLQGQLLLDGGKLRGSFFHRSVVLICQHDDNGAFGLVLNRTMASRVGELILERLPESIQEHPLFLGGPVQPGALSYLHTDDYLPQANVMPLVNLGHSLDELHELAQSFSTTKKVRIFAGYAGWSPGQLDSEIENEAWLVHPASRELIFEASAESLWEKILQQKNWQHQLLAQSPEDPSWN